MLCYGILFAFQHNVKQLFAHRGEMQAVRNKARLNTDASLGNQSCNRVCYSLSSYRVGWKIWYRLLDGHLVGSNYNQLFFSSSGWKHLMRFLMLVRFPKIFLFSSTQLTYCVALVQVCFPFSISCFFVMCMPSTSPNPPLLLSNTESRSQ